MSISGDSDVEGTLSANIETSKSSIKRKRHDGEVESEQQKPTKRKRRSKKPKDINDADLDGDLGINNGLSKMDARLLSDYVAQRTKRFEPELSHVELEDRYIPESAIADTTSWLKPRTTDNLADFIRKFSPKNIDLDKAPSTPGSPHILVIASAGLRAAELVRSLRTFQTKEGKVEKLFAKHIKLKEAIETCGKVRMSFGVGTPQRVYDLIDNGALKMDKLRVIVLDASHIDTKKRGVLDMKEVQVPLVKLLAMNNLKERYGKDGLQLLFY
ncbi:hypothetical protein EJ05DRAFT_465606 [Pseudovirgaria hyperparasitica]|uniref:Protein CMS1 n=1 Tax=Pseudovirgaria hyperparasitica TaxID=470096 RepID=A0A6A6W7C7_9PEZI|nr:uncharacterized protein EJ05DRAFT_465606 [Pseudovirgaria hyperparasitica]KAF2757477.1 hypothetical protein EJ05DRAFT_465606 [Pseudovirgaria hyperparasitica]